MAETGICRLCKSRGELTISHIVSSFVYKWLKDSASTPFLRFGEDINKRAQDGLKLPFLCRSCEERFNSSETPFARDFFRPFHDKRQRKFNYGPWMAKCVASVVWRVLAWRQEQEWAARDISPVVSKDIDHALATWSEFLLDRSQDLGDHELHLVPLDAIAAVDGPAPSANIHRYLLRSIAIDLIRDSQSATVYCKMGRAVLLGFVREPEAARWEGTRIEVGSGTLGASNLTVPDWLLRYLWSKGERLEELESSLSARQCEKIAESQAANPERVAHSDTMRALIADAELRWKLGGEYDS